MSARVDESLLIRSGTYCGHRFEKDGFRAVWFIEEEQIKLYGKDGQLLRVLRRIAQLSTERILATDKQTSRLDSSASASVPHESAIRDSWHFQAGEELLDHMFEVPPPTVPIAAMIPIEDQALT